MIALRVLGGVAAVLLFAISSVRYHHRRTSRRNLILSWAVGVVLGLLAIDPDVFNPAFDLFNFRRGSQLRLIGLLMVAVAVLFALLIRATDQLDSNVRSVRELVEALAVHHFDRAQLVGLPPGPRVAVVMPAYDEADNVGAVVHAVPERVHGLPVVTLVVDDASEDETAEAARRAGAIVARLPIRRGGGLALRVGYDIALHLLDAKVVVTMDADGQHVPDEMPLLVKPILEDEADMVNGSRVLGEFERESRIRHWGVHVFSWLVTLLTGSRITDVSNGYRATRADVMRRLVLDQDQFWTSELLIEAMRQRLRVREVPITVRARTGGESKKPKTLRYAKNFAKAIIRTWLR
jgi:hypothetical protein